MVIDEYFYNPEAKSGSMVASATKGVLRYVGGQISHSSGVTITTPSAVLGIRGGIATIMVALSESIAQLDHNLRGRVGNELVINHFGSITIKNNVSQVTLRPGEATVIASVNQPIAVPFKVTDASLQQILRSQTSRSGQNGGFGGRGSARRASSFPRRRVSAPPISQTPPARPVPIRSDTTSVFSAGGRRLKEQISDEPGAERGSASASAGKAKAAPKSAALLSLSRHASLGSRRRKTGVSGRRPPVPPLPHSN